MLPAALKGARSVVAGVARANPAGFFVRTGRVLYVGSAGILAMATYSAWKNQRNGHGLLKTIQTGKWSPEDADNPKGSNSFKGGRGNATTPTETAHILELFYPDADPYGGHQNHGHLAMSDRGLLREIGKKLQGFGFRVGEHPDFGGVAPVHTTGSWHYVGKAIDFNWPNTTEERARLRWAAQWIVNYVEQQTSHATNRYHGTDYRGGRRSGT